MRAKDKAKNVGYTDKKFNYSRRRFIDNVGYTDKKIN